MSTSFLWHSKNLALLTNFFLTDQTAVLDSVLELMLSYCPVLRNFLNFSGRRLAIRATETDANEGLVSFNAFHFPLVLLLSLGC